MFVISAFHLQAMVRRISLFFPSLESLTATN